MSTKENLQRALAEESKNRERYLAFAEAADAEGAGQVARLFRAAAESERIHARVELRALGEVRSTVENVRQAVDIEEKEFQDTYARFLREARAEGDQKAARLFGNILDVERGHHKLFREVLTSLLGEEDIPEAPILVCDTCGNTAVGEAPATCPVCGASSEHFAEIA